VPPASGPSPLVSRDGRETLLPATLRARAGDSVVGRLKSAFSGDPAVSIGGNKVAGKQTGSQATKDLATAELIAFPLLTLLSLLVFRGVSALLPVAVGGLSVLGAFTGLRAIDAAIFALAVRAQPRDRARPRGWPSTTACSACSRFREELGRGADVPDAVRTR